MQNSQNTRHEPNPPSVMSKRNQEIIHLMVSIDTTQDSIVEASAKIIKMAVARKESTTFQSDVILVWQD